MCAGLCVSVHDRWPSGTPSFIVGTHHSLSLSLQLTSPGAPTRLPLRQRLYSKHRLLIGTLNATSPSHPLYPALACDRVCLCVCVPVCVSACNPHLSTLTFHAARAWNASAGSKLSLITPSQPNWEEIWGRKCPLAPWAERFSPPLHADWRTCKGQCSTHPHLLQVIVVAKWGKKRDFFGAWWLQTIFRFQRGQHYTRKWSSA